MKLKRYSFKNRKFRRLLVLFLLIGVFTFLSTGRYFNNISGEVSPVSFLEQDDLETQDLDASNTFTGTGDAWNVTHWANRTDYNLAASFTNSGYDTVQIPLGLDWEGYRLDSSIFNLYDTRNWNNGTFDFGTDDGTYAAGEDDTAEITNPYQNWTFIENDVIGSNNLMSGNYYSNLGGHSSLELRMDGVLSGGYRYYDNGDNCMWNSSFWIDRGAVIDSTLQFDVNPYYLTDFNSWELAFRLNNVKIYSIGVYNLKLYGAGVWRTFTIPQNVWVNTSNVYVNPVTDIIMNISIALEYNSATAGYSTGFTNIEYQQLFVDNVKIVPTCEVNPSQIQLKLNSTDISDVDWGKGDVSINGNWNTDYVIANFSSPNVWALGDFIVELKTNLNLFATKPVPETSYNPNFISEGTKFTVESGNLVNWESYSYFAVPTGYRETTMRLEFPTDITITWVSEPQLPSTNRLSLCDSSTPGALIIPVDTISATPDGFWKFEATSPNHLNSLDILKNTTISPGPNDWASEDEFYSGDYINFTAAVNLSPLFSGYITQTQALLQIRFPNGTIWNDKSQLKYCEASGDVYFDYFQIPTNPPDYEVGEYTAIITWNNSYSTLGLNETGIITKTFTVKHFSTLTPDQSYYSNIFEGDSINLIVSFNDKENGDAIEGALVYTDNFLGGREYFNEISPGFYVLLDFNTTGGIAGDNVLTIYANSSLYQNNLVSITINLVLRTTLTAEEFPYLQVPWNENFTIHLNYTEVSTGNGIIATPTSNWLGESSITMISPGVYDMELNSSLYEVSKIHSLIINFDEPNYETQNILIKIEITERETYIDNIFLNGVDKTTERSITLTSGELLNISISYKDEISDAFISGATARAIGGGLSEFLVENLVYPQYDLIINTSVLSIGATFLTVSAQLQNYSSSATVLTIYLGERGSSLEVLLNGKTYPDNYINVTVWQTINITVKYTDLITGDHLAGATIELLEFGYFEENALLGQYNYTVDASVLGEGIDILSIIATKDNYQSQPAQITVEITKVFTSLQLFFNDEDQTVDPFLEIPIGSDLNITVKYTDLSGTFVDGADVELIGEGLSNPFTPYPALEHYSLTLNTRQLDIGVRLLTIIANKSNYEIQIINIRLDIKRIQVNITIAEGTITNIRPGQSADIKIELHDFEQLIYNATVEYRLLDGTYIMARGTLEDEDNNGIYEVLIRDIPEGTFKLIIAANAGDDYDIEQLELTIVVTRSPEEIQLFIILAIIGAIVSVGLLTYLYLYQKVLKYPKPIRKVRKYRKSLSRSRGPKTSITSRNKAFEGSYKSELAKASKSIIGKPSEATPMKDKFIEKPEIE